MLWYGNLCGMTILNTIHCLSAFKPYVYYACVMSSAPSAVQRVAFALLEEQHPESPDENSKNEYCDRLVFHYLLDSILPAGPVVLVPPQRPWGEGLPLTDPHPVHLWARQRLPGPTHLWAVHYSLPQGAPEVLLQWHHSVRPGQPHGCNWIFHFCSQLSGTEKRREPRSPREGHVAQSQPQRGRVHVTKRQVFNSRQWRRDGSKPREPHMRRAQVGGSLILVFYLFKCNWCLTVCLLGSRICCILCVILIHLIRKTLLYKTTIATIIAANKHRML